nr:amino acid permease 1 [Quercus suber]
MQWRIGDGNHARLFHDNWIPGQFPTKAVPSRLEAISDAKVSSMIDLNSREWNMELLENCVAPFFIQKILAIPICRTNQDDVLFWPRSKDGSYTVKTGYQLLCELEKAEDASSSNTASLVEMYQENLELFVVVAWSIWLIRNKGRVNEPCTPLDKIFEAAHIIIFEYQTKTTPRQPVTPSITMKWKPPRPVRTTKTWENSSNKAANSGGRGDWTDATESVTVIGQTQLWWIERKNGSTSIAGVTVGVDVTRSQKAFNSLQALGNIALAYFFSNVLIEIQASQSLNIQSFYDTLKSSPPENLVMKKASVIGVSITSVFYLLCGGLGYAAFGNLAPGNFLTGFGFYEPYWLVNIANICIVVHLVGAYQLFSQPVYQLVEDWCKSQWPESDFIVEEHQIVIPFVGNFNINFFRCIWRTVYVIFTTVIAMLFPVFNSVLGLIGAASFWPLTVYFPIEMYISQTKIRSFSLKWFGLKTLSWFCFIVTIVAAVASIRGIIIDLGHYKPFKSVS